MKLQHIIFKAAIASSILFASCDKASDADRSKEAKEPSPVMETVQFSPPVVKDEESISSGLSQSETEKSNSNNSPVEQSGNAVKIPEKIKKTADINITVNDYKAARAAIEKIVHSGSAYIAGENEQNSTYSISNTMVIRVSNKQFDATVNNVAGIPGHVNSKNIYMEDVTAEFVDITARLKSKKEVEERYRAILLKANKVSDILEVEGQLRIIREEIEAKEGQLKYLNDQVDYSTINLTIQQDFEYTPQDRPGFFGRMGTAFGNGWNGFLSFLVGMMYAWPLWVILCVGGLLLYRFIKRRAKRK
jgi:hypothetical protein